MGDGKRLYDQHGNSKFLQERLYEQSDKYDVTICQIVVILTNKTTCNSCATDNVSQIKLPYVKLVIQELMLC